MLSTEIALLVHLVVQLSKESKNLIKL